MGETWERELPASYEQEDYLTNGASLGGRMALNEAILPEFDREMADVRRCLEGLQDDEFNWRPHQDSMTLGELATHMATISHVVDAIIYTNFFDVGNDPPQPVLESREAVLNVFDRNAVSARIAIAGASDDQLVDPWSLLKESQFIFTLPRLGALRNLVLNHSVRHRADLRACLRVKDVRVAPSLYRDRATSAATPPDASVVARQTDMPLQ